MKFVILCKMNREFAEKMSKAFPADAFDKGLESGQRVTKEALIKQGLSEDMARTIEAHIEYWWQFKTEGLLLEGGPFEGFQRALLIVIANSINQVKDLIKRDPYIEEGVFVDYEIHRWHKVL